MFCANCGASNEDDVAFCSKCGASLRDSAAGLPGSSSKVAGAGPSETSGKAIGSLICGFFFFILPAAIVAIVLGHMSLSEIRKSGGRLRGNGAATTGLVFGYMGVAVIPLILIIAAIAIPNLLRARMVANQASAVGSLRAINTASFSYADKYKNGFPPSLETLDGAGTRSAGCDHAHLIDILLATGQKNGYRFSYTAIVTNPQRGYQLNVSRETEKNGCTLPGTDPYALQADPIQGTTGQSSYYTDQTGVIRLETDKPATVDSPPIQ